MSENPTAEALLEFFNALEAAIATARQTIVQLRHPNSTESGAICETSFNILSFEKQTGAKIGEYEVAHKKANLPDKWNHAHNVLRQNNATIGKRYHSEGYTYSYWLYGEDKIYRQNLKPQ